MLNFYFDCSNLLHSDADLPLLRHVGRLEFSVRNFAVLQEEVTAFALLGGVAQLAEETTTSKILQVLHLLLQLKWVRVGCFLLGFHVD